MAVSKKLLVGGGVAIGLAAAAYVYSKKISTSSSQGGATSEKAPEVKTVGWTVTQLKKVAPKSAYPYLEFVIEAANKYGISPLIILALGQQESRWGDALKPKGPGGSGDYMARNWAAKDTTGMNVIKCTNEFVKSLRQRERTIRKSKKR